MKLIYFLTNIMVLFTILELGVRMSASATYHILSTIGGYSYGLIFGRAPTQEELTQQLLKEVQAQRLEIRSLRRDARLLKSQVGIEPDTEPDYDMLSSDDYNNEIS